MRVVDHSKDDVVDPVLVAHHQRLQRGPVAALDAPHEREVVGIAVGGIAQWTEWSHGCSSFRRGGAPTLPRWTPMSGECDSTPDAAISGQWVNDGKCSQIA